jgi:hypothetical protein
MQGASYKLASDAIFLTGIPFLFGGLQSSAARTFLAATVHVVQYLIWNRERAQEHERQRMSVYVVERPTRGVAGLICKGWECAVPALTSAKLGRTDLTVRTQREFRQGAEESNDNGGSGMTVEGLRISRAFVEQIVEQLWNRRPRNRVENRLTTRS